MTNKLSASLLLCLLLTVSALGQIKKPAKWSNPTLSKQNPAVGETIEISFNATIDEGWYLYSSDFDPNLGPIVTTFNYEGSTGVEIVGDIKPINPKKAFDDLWGGDYTYFEPKGTFKQKVKITSENPTVKVKVEYQTCQHEGSCIGDKKKFEIAIKTAAAKTSSTPKETTSSVNEKMEKVVKKTEPKVVETVEKVEKTVDKVTPKETAEETVVETDSADSTQESSVSQDQTDAETQTNVRFKTVNGSIAVDHNGNNHVQVNGKWHQVPGENSPKFYQKYLQLGGTNE